MLTKARKVMTMLVSLGNTTTNAVDAMSVSDRDKCFESAYLALSALIWPDTDQLTMDARRIGDRSFTTVYDLINKLDE